MRTNHENAGIRCAQHKHRSLSALISLSVVVTLGGASIGCSGESIYDEVESSDTRSSTIDNDAAEDALIQAELEARGYDTSNLQFEGDTVIVEGDMVMSRAALLHGREDEAGNVEKGYFAGTARFSGKSIAALTFAAGVSNAWRTAFNAARTEWNLRTPKFSQPGPGSALTINVVTGNLGTSTFANGTFPGGRTITLNTSYNSSSCKPAGSLDNSIEGLAANVKTKVAIHEMGHVLGFEHPPPQAGTGSRVHITGTATSPNVGATPSYTTVMAQGCISMTSLATDDRTSVQKKYPSCVDECNHNCTFNVDPAQIGLCQSACPSQCGA